MLNSQELHKCYLKPDASPGEDLLCAVAVGGLQFLRSFDWAWPERGPRVYQKVLLWLGAVFCIHLGQQSANLFSK